MSAYETERNNVIDALEQGREDWINADDPVSREHQMVALDHLLDVANKMGYFAAEASIEISTVESTG